MDELARWQQVLVKTIPVKTLPITPESFKKVQIGNDQEKAQSEKDSHSKNRGGKN